MRSFSVSEQSTRYCNYSKDKFNGELKCVIPEWLCGLTPEKSYRLFKSSEYAAKPGLEYNFIKSCCTGEYFYMDLIKKGCKPQEAREVLPLCIATEVAYTGFEEDWKYFFDLRCSESAHPDIRKLANELKLLINK
jgi:thymidylate synthase (FAD)